MQREDPSAGAPYRDFLREFLYVDVGRIRSYLAQLTEGVPDHISEAAEQGSTHDAGLKVSGVGLGRAAARSTRWEETRTYGDLLVPLFEEHAESAGFLTDVTGDIEQVDGWQSGAVHHLFEPGKLFRWTGLVRLFDSTHMADSVRRFEEMSEAVVKLQSGQQPRRANERSGRVTQPARAESGGLDAKALRRMTEPFRDLLQNLLSGGIGLRMLACGTASPECGFGGTLLDRSDYIEPERAAVFSRYGFEPAEWTVIASVARIPRRSTGEVASTFDAAGLVRTQGSIDRGRLEEMALTMLSMFEGIGLTEAPVWPSIAVTPLAVYRTIGSSLHRAGEDT